MMPGVDGPEASPEAPVATSAQAPAETRADVRRRREAEQRSAVPDSANTVHLPLLLVTVVTCGLLVLAVRAEPAILAAALAWCALILAGGLPHLYGISPDWPVATPIGIAGIGTAVAAGVVDTAPHLRLVPIALAAGTVLSCLLQILRRDGREGLVLSLSVAGAGLALIAMGIAYVPVARLRDGADLVTAALAGVAVSALADLFVGRQRVRPWLLPLSMVLGGCAGALVAVVAGAPRSTLGLLLGMMAAATAYLVRRLATSLPTVGGLRAQGSAAAASVLAPGVVTYVIGLLFLG